MTPIRIPDQRAWQIDDCSHPAWVVEQMSQMYILTPDGNAHELDEHGKSKLSDYQPSGRYFIVIQVGEEYAALEMDASREQLDFLYSVAMGALDEDPSHVCIEECVDDVLRVLEMREI